MHTYSLPACIAQRSCNDKGAAFGSDDALSNPVQAVPDLTVYVHLSAIMIVQFHKFHAKPSDVAGKFHIAD